MMRVGRVLDDSVGAFRPETISTVAPLSCADDDGGQVRHVVVDHRADAQAFAPENDCRNRNDKRVPGRRA